MICYNCGLKVHNTNAKECHFCGVKFGSLCNSCKAPNPVMAKFCFNCGNLMTASKEASSVQNYSVLSESRKNVAILFADVSGFTALSEKLDPEIVREIINDCFNYITAPVYELGGIIDKYIGDCVMVLFGAKTSHIDDAKRAVLCAVKMSKLIQEFSEERIKPLGFELQLSIGVHFGLVVTGKVGNYYDMDYTVMGDTVNTAQRIQSNTPKSFIYVSEAVYKETRIDIEYNGPISITAKNKENPIICYIPYSIKNPLSSTQEKIPMVGRQNSLEKLLVALEVAEHKQSFVAGITGPAGIGKSTLIEEFLYLSKEDVKVIKTECNPALINSPYYLITNLLMNIMNIQPGEALLVKQSRIISYISFLLSKHDEEAIKRNYQFISFLMGMEVDKETRDIISSMDTKSIFKEITRQLELLFIEFENKFRSLIIIEDIHWSDARSLTLLKEIWSNNSSRNGHNLYLYTSRSYIEDLKVLPSDNNAIIQLEPLDDDSIIEYIKLYIGCDKVDRTCVDYVTNFSGGNPLYIHELLKYIKMLPLFYISDYTVYLNKDIEKIPNSLQGLILSKLNYLSQEATEIAQAASIIGKDFTTSVLSKLLDKNIDVDDYLKEAVNSNIIYLKHTYTNSGHREKLYSFSHETERETIYNSILNKQKTYYHREAAKAIETLYARNIESYYELLGEHFEKGSEPINASVYYSSAAQHYKNLFNTQEALIYFLKAYNCIAKLKQASKEKLYFLTIQIGELYSIMSDFTNAKLYLSKALRYTEDINEKWAVELDLARILKDQAQYKKAMAALDNIQEEMKPSHPLYGSLLFLKCTIQRVTGQSQQALINIKKAESILLKNKDYINLAKVLNAAGIIYHTNSDIDNALKSYLKAYKYSEKIGDLQTLMKCAANMATIYHIQSDLNNAMRYFNSAMELSKKISHRQGYVTSSNNLGILYMDKGLFIKARILFEEAAKISKETSTLFMQSASLSNLADIEYYMGNYITAMRYAVQALEISREIEDKEGAGINNITLAKINIEQTDLKSAKKYLDTSHEIYCELNSDDGWSDYYYYLSQYYMELNNYSEALMQAHISKDLALKCQNNRKQAKSSRLIGVLLQKQEDFTNSLAYFNESIELLEKEEAAYELTKSLFLRAVTYNKLNKTEAANKDLKSASANMKKIDKCKWTKIIEHGIN
jgi:class 3 adenylate cyclase/predicted ATPase